VNYCNNSYQIINYSPFVLLNQRTLLILCTPSVQPLEYLIKVLLVPMKQATSSLIKVKSCNALLCMLLVCICSYVKSVL